MEAVAALGIAGNAVQFLDFATKLCSISKEIYRDTHGASAANRQSQFLVREFLEKLDEVSRDVGLYFEALATASQPSQSPNDLQVSLVIKDCQDIAQDLSVRLGKLKASGTHGKWKSFIKGLECAWKRHELDELEGRLWRNRRELEWRIMLSLREGLNLLASRQEDQFREHQAAMTATLSDVIKDQFSSLPMWPQVGEKVLDSVESTPGYTTFNDGHPDTDGSRLVNVGQDISAHTWATSCAKSLADFELRLWKSLYFPILRDREDHINDAEKKTFEWILRSPRAEHQPWSNFHHWLLSDSSIYWIQGKAGSGKSTMLKFLHKHPVVKQALDTWAKKSHLVFVQFYFWYNGSTLQKTQEGMLRSILYQALRDHRELIPIVLPQPIDIAMDAAEITWTLCKLKEAYHRLLEQDSISIKLCMMIDGLDEFAGDHAKLVSLIQIASDLKHVKICVTSRPLLVFERAFERSPGLIMQHLTFDDINTFVKQRFRSDERFRELELEDLGLSSFLASEVISKASGVFLWVTLVVKSLLDGIQNFDRREDLFRRLDELPEDLEELYQHMLSRINPSWYLEETIRLLYLVQVSNGNLTLLRLAFAELEQAPSMKFLEALTVEKQHSLCYKMAGRIKSRCLGLIEVSGAAHRDVTELDVRFLHKSVSDFVDSPHMSRKVQSFPKLAAHLQPTQALLKGLVIELQTVRSRFRDEHFHRDDGLKRSTWFDEIRPLENIALGYLECFSNVDWSTHNLLEDIYDLMAQYWEMVKRKNFGEDWRTAERICFPQGPYHENAYVLCTLLDMESA